MSDLVQKEKDIQPPIISAYDDGGFTLGGTFIKGSIIITGAEGTGFEISNWPVTSADHINPEDLDVIYQSQNAPSLIVLGVGAEMNHPFAQLRAALSKRGIALEIQTTPAACRTWNLLLSEGRKVAFAAVAL